MASSIRKDLFNLPNLLTMLRIVLIPVSCWLLLRGDPLSCFLTAIVYGIASATDYFDGYLARARNLVTLTGKFLDPLADKLIVMGMLVVLVDLGWFPGWLVILVLAREIAITGLRALAASEGFVIAAEKAGKYKTAFQLCGLAALTIHYTYPVNFLVLESSVNFHRVGFTLFAVSVFFSYYSAVGYVMGFYGAMAKREAATAAAESTPTP